jgi:hypothetical protein
MLLISQDQYMLSDIMFKRRDKTFKKLLNFLTHNTVVKFELNDDVRVCWLANHAAGRIINIYLYSILTL